MSGDGQRPWQFQENSRRLFPKWAISVSHRLSSGPFWIYWSWKGFLARLDFAMKNFETFTFSLGGKNQKGTLSPCVFPMGIEFSLNPSIYLPTYLCIVVMVIEPGPFQRWGNTGHLSHIINSFYLLTIIITYIYSPDCPHILCSAEKVLSSSFHHLSPCPAGFAILICSYVGWGKGIST